MAKVKGIAHVGIAVENIDKAFSALQEILGAKLQYKREIPDQKQISAIVSIGDLNLELMEPTHEDGVVGKYLKSRGQGQHHISLEVEGLAELVVELEKRGVTVVGKSLEGKEKIAFLHPKSTAGILFELTERG